MRTRHNEEFIKDLDKIIGMHFQSWGQEPYSSFFDSCVAQTHMEHTHFLPNHFLVGQKLSC